MREDVGQVCLIELPRDFRAGDVLAFHGRDPLLLAERVSADMLQKGLAWRGRAACLMLRFQPRHVEAELAIDGAAGHRDTVALTSMVRRMLGLTQRVDDFEQTYRTHPQLGPLIARRPGLRVPLSPTPFEALTWAIIGQQISVTAAVALRRRLIQAAGLVHSSGLACYPDARRLAGLSEAELRQTGLSGTKARTLSALSRLVQEELLPLEAWTETLPVDDIRARLLGVRGIGPWTVNYALLRGFGWLDGSLHGDAAVRRGLQTLLGETVIVTVDYAERWLAEFSPWRALIAAHLWAMRPSDDDSSVSPG
ncbi:MAG: AlkA N-terminal domain-containing protein [Pseudomonadota bacterium]